jgi:hypothetical protein
MADGDDCNGRLPLDSQDWRKGTAGQQDTGGNPGPHLEIIVPTRPDDAELGPGARVVVPFAARNCF